MATAAMASSSSLPPLYHRNIGTSNKNFSGRRGSVFSTSDNTNNSIDQEGITVDKNVPLNTNSSKPNNKNNGKINMNQKSILGGFSSTDNFEQGNTSTSNIAPLHLKRTVNTTPQKHISTEYTTILSSNDLIQSSTKYSSCVSISAISKCPHLLSPDKPNNAKRRSIFPQSCYEQRRQPATLVRSTSQQIPTTRTNESDVQSEVVNSPVNDGRKYTLERPSRTRAQTVAFPLNRNIESTPKSKVNNNVPLHNDLKVHGVSRQEIWEFVRPPDCQYQAGHLKDIEQVPNLNHEFGLPELPSPLQRLRKSSGVYPMLSPQSILRKKNLGATTKQDPFERSRELNSFNLAKKLTETMAGSDLAYGIANSQTSKLGNVPASRSSSCSFDSKTSDGSRGRSIRFDPRVTVTEYEDSVPRKWYSENELRQFQSSTVLLVKQYLMKNPDALIEYNTPRLDPVTGVMRRKALFSLPVLGCSGRDDNGLTDESCADNIAENYEAAHLIILIVDRNQLILDLFRRSLQLLFPKAKIITSDSGEHAAEIIRSNLSPHSDDNQESIRHFFDIVIAEERLYIPLQRSPVVTLNRKGSGVSEDTAGSKHNRVQSFNSVVPGANGSAGWNGLSGSELFQFIKDMEREAISTSKSSPQTPIFFPLPCSLLIGVSTNPSQDSKRFLEYGADFVWGKPPPNMNPELRRSLMAALITKRKKLEKSLN